MKKALSIIMAVALLCTVIITANAGTPNPGTVTITGDSAITIDGTKEYTIAISGCENATAVAVEFSCGESFTITAGEWLKSGMIPNVDLTKNKAALGGLSSPDVNGNLFKLTVKADSAAATAQDLTVTVTAKNGSSVIFNETATIGLTAACAEHTFGAWSQKSAATCTKPEVEHQVCSKCGYEETREVGAVLEHSFGDWQVTTPATCTTAGVETRTCTRECGEPGATETRPVAALGHNFGAWQTTTPATCTTAGVETRTCTRECGEEGATETRPINALGHSYGDWQVTTPATCTTAGVETRTCTKECGEEGATQTQTINALGHDWGEWVVVEEATETEMGLEKRICKNDSSHIETRDIRITYKVEEGDKAEYKAEDGEDFVIISNAAFDKFEGVMVDGDLIAPGNYEYIETEEGTKVVIKASYMTVLADGPHTITVVSTDGDATATIEVEGIPTPAPSTNGDSENTSPKTGDNSMVEFWIAMMFILSAGAYVAKTLVKKSKAN